MFYSFIIRRQRSLFKTENEKKRGLKLQPRVPTLNEISIADMFLMVSDWY